MKATVIAMALAVAWASTAAADEYFKPTRADRKVPAHCTEPELRHFPLAQRQLVYGIKGATAVGFTHEYPISREDAGYLWMVFLGGRENDPGVVKEIRRKKLEAPYQVLKEARATMDFTFEKEGDVLEALAINDLAREYPSPQFFITGGIEYREEAGAKTMGELDLVVAQKDGCRVVAIGESKLGVKQLGHAREQLARFKDFLKSKCSASGSCR